MVESRTVRIPEDLFGSVQKILLKGKGLGYQSPSEFIVDAIRHRIEEIRTQNKPSEGKKRERKIISDFV